MKQINMKTLYFLIDKIYMLHCPWRLNNKCKNLKIKNSINQYVLNLRSTFKCKKNTIVALAYL